MSNNNVKQKMQNLNEDIWSLVNSHQPETTDDVMVVSAVLLKCAVQLYTVALKDDDIEEILTGHAVESIPALREACEEALTRKLH